MTGKELKEKVRDLQIRVIDFARFCAVANERPEDVKAIARTYYHHCSAFLNRDFPKETLKLYVKGLNAAIHSTYKINTQSEEVDEALKGPNNKLLAKMLEVVMNENRILQKTIEENSDDIKFLLAEVKKLNNLLQPKPEHEKA